IVHGLDRADAIATMRRALDELIIEGVTTTLPLHRRIFRNRDFIEGRVDTTWVERVLMSNAPAPNATGRILREGGVCGRRRGRPRHVEPRWGSGGRGGGRGRLVGPRVRPLGDPGL